MIKAGIVLLCVVILLIVGNAFIPCESYNYIYPNIDTTYATGYTERGFSEIATGMHMQRVEQILGTPLIAWTNKSHAAWYYTKDGKCAWGDFAWFVRTIYFTNGCVENVERRIGYD